MVVDSGGISQGTANTAQQWAVPFALTPGKKYQAQVRVSDGTDWSAWSNIGWLITNRPPTATMLVPGGTQANPTVFNAVRPTLQWSQSDPDAGTQFSYFQIQITNESNTVMIVDSGQYYQGSWASTGSWTVNQDLPAGQKLQVWVRVFDGYVWSSYSPKTWMYINRAPTGTIAIQPSTVYQNDDVTVTIVPTDPDGDAVNIQVESSIDGGTYQTIYTASAIPSGTTKAFMMLDVPQGSYTLRLTLTDPLGASYQTLLSFTAHELQTWGYVRHTPQWEINRQNYNAAHPGNTRGPMVFWAGERLMVAADVTNTGTATVASTVTAKLLGPGTSVGLSSANRVNWSGELWDKEFDQLADGLYTVRFTTVWSNGYIQTYDVPITIKNKMYSFLVTQLRD